MATLPQTNVQGAAMDPTGYQMSIGDLPKFGATLNSDGTIAPNAWNRGAAIAAARAGMQQDPNVQAAAQATGLPSYDPNALSLVQTPANGVMGQGTGLQNYLEKSDAGVGFGNRFSRLQSQTTPGVTDAVSNWLFNKAGSPEAQAYSAKSAAGNVYSRPETAGYLSAHPSLLAAAEKDPVGFATKLGPILDAAVQAQAGKGTKGVIASGNGVKPDDHVERTNAVVTAFDVSPQHAHAMTQPHHYTRDEFLNATEGLPRGALKNMWEMQHYLNPQQQALSTALSIAQQKANTGDNAAKAEYYNMLKIVGGIAPNINEIQPPAGTN